MSNPIEVSSNAVVCFKVKTARLNEGMPQLFLETFDRAFLPEAPINRVTLTANEHEAKLFSDAPDDIAFANACAEFIGGSVVRQVTTTTTTKLEEEIECYAERNERTQSTIHQGSGIGD